MTDGCLTLKSDKDALIASLARAYYQAHRKLAEIESQKDPRTYVKAAMAHRAAELELYAAIEGEEK